MKRVSPISFDFNWMEVSFEKRGRKMTLTGGKEIGTCKMITWKRVQRVFKKKIVLADTIVLCCGSGGET